MSGFEVNLDGAIEAESGNNNSEADSDEVTRFEANEVADGYILGMEFGATLDTATTEALGFERPPIQWEDTLSDYPQIVEEHDLNDQQKLCLIAKLFKGTIGDMQSDLNDGYGNGLDNDYNPPKPYDNENTHYGDVFRHLPAWEWEGLTESEKEKFEEEGVDISEMGFDRNFEGPKLPVIDGERVPIVVEEGDEVQRLLEMLNSIDFDGLTYCEEHGTLQGTPTLGPEDSEKVGDGKESNPSLAEKPEKVQDLFIPELEEEIEEIESERTLETILRVEEENKDRKGAKDAIEVRLESLDTEDEEVTEESEAASDDEVKEVIDIFGVDAETAKEALEARDSGHFETTNEAIEHLV